MKSAIAAWLPVLVMGVAALPAAGQAPPEAPPASPPEKQSKAIGYRVGGGAPPCARFTDVSTVLSTMNTGNRCLFWAAVAVSVAYPALGSLRGNEAMYAGGTKAGVSEKTVGRLDLSGEQSATFVWKEGSSLIQYKNITSLEYGQKAGRRVGVALVVSPIALFSKKRKHYVTAGFNDDQGKKQGAVFEVAKGAPLFQPSRFQTRP